MKTSIHRLLVTLLVLQQVSFGLPASAENVQAGKPLDAGAMSDSRTSGGNAQVGTNLFTGDATFRVPLVVPPGTGGFTPRASLAYSSGASTTNGPLGVGWSLDVGPAMIERSTRDGAPRYDNVQDTFALGGQDLVETGTPGRFVSENHDFQRIERLTGEGDYWRVLRTDGTRLYYGHAYDPAPPSGPPNDSRLHSAALSSFEGTPASCPSGYWVFCFAKESILPSGIPFAWYLDRMEDRNGNVIHFRWESLGDPGARYLVEIRYSGHVGGGVDAVPDFGGSDDATLSRTRTVTFGYDTLRNDEVPSYRTGFRRQIRHRLSDVTVAVDGQPVRHYVLEYEQSPASGRSRLIFVRDRGADDSAATEYVHGFTYGDGGTPGWSAKNMSYGLPAVLSFVSGGRDTGLRLIDVNNDAYPDVVRASSGTYATYLGGPGGFGGASATWASPINVVEGSNQYAGTTFGDLDGDGRPDLIRRRLNVTGTNAVSGTSCGTSRQHEVGSLTSAAFVNTGAGWSADASHDPAPVLFSTEPLFFSGSAQSCPNENLNLASRLTGLSARFDQATRLVDLNGDGRSDLIYKRALSGSHPEGFVLWTTYGLRAGTLINGPNGLASGIFNNSHWGLTLGDLTGTDVEFGKLYDHPEWQPPFNSAQGVFWSNFNTCKASQNVWAGGHSGKERLADLNGDGLPEILESALWFPCEGCAGYSLKAAYVNNGYGWQYTAGGTPEPYMSPPYWFYEATSGETITNFDQFANTFCQETEPGGGEDFGVRLVDVNGDGRPDLIGGGSPPPEGIGRVEAALWDATAPNLGSGNSLWRPAGEWNIPEEFSASNGQDPGLRLADVNADGMIDIVASDGAYLNLGEPPDRLETVASPWGAVTSIEYDPHTIFDDFTVPPEVNPTIDGQRRADRPRWVVTAIETDPGFGQPSIRQEFEYDDGVYDVDDRAFRGFSKVTSLGPVGDGVRRVTETFFHTGDALRGRPAEVAVSSAPASNPETRTLRNRVTHEYAHASGLDSVATVTYANGSTATLDTVDPVTQAQAFAPFAALMSGAPGAFEAHLALVVGTEVEVTEGTANSVLYRREQTVDAYGNVTEERDLGDETPDGGGQTDPTDDVTTSRQFALLDAVVGSQHVLLTNRPSQIVVTGNPGSLPAETIVSRTLRIYYDNSLTLGQVARGNATVVEQDWQDASRVVRVARIFDVYGNRKSVSTPFDAALPQNVLFLNSTYDSASHTFATSLAAASLAHPELNLQSTYEYELPGCGAPLGMGLVCRAIDGTGRESNMTYDAFGRQVAYAGPNGAAFTLDYHDADRGTVDQRTERRTRWDPDAPSSPENDSDAIATTLHYDGLRRTLTLERPGLSTATANRTFSYDSAGRMAQSTRWESGQTLGEATLYDYDALGRTIQRMRPDGTLFDVAYEPRKVTTTSDEPNDGIVHRRIEHFDGRGRLAEVEEFEDPAECGVSTFYRYDPFDQVVVIENPVTGDLSLCGGDPVCEGQTHTTEILYDELGNRTRLIDPDAGTILTTYDARGMVDTEEDARGFVQDFTIDDLGRLVRRHAVNPQGMESDDVFEYGLAGVHGPNQVGRLVRVDDAEGHAEFDDDEAGNLSWHRRVVQGREFDFTRTYDPLGRVVDTSYPDGEVATWHYDKRLLTRISTAGGDYGDDYVASIAYDALDRLTGVELGGSAGSPAVTQSWGYDPISGRLDSIAAVVGGSSVDLDYTIDGVGRIRAIKSEFTIAPAAPVLRSFTFEYDGLDRLTEAAGDYDTVDPLLQKTLRYDHDVLGNLVQKDSDADAQVDDGWALSYQDPTRPHAVTSSVHESGFPTRAFDYDASGNVTSKWTQASATDPLVEALLTYDSVGRLVEYDPQTSPGLIWALGYDGFGRRIVSKRGGLTLLYPEPGYEYHQNLTRVNKHFFVGGRRVASSEVAWTAPEAGATPSALAAGRPALAALASRPGLRGPALAAPRLRPARAALARGDGEAPSARARRAPGHVPVLHDGRQLQLLAQPAGHARGDGPLLRHRPPGVDCGHGQARRHRPERLPVPALRGHVIDSGPVIHHRFAGEDLLGSGLIALGPRSYDPELGRFLQPDPIVPNPADPQSLSPYSYVLNHPLNLVDPTGLYDESPGPRVEIERTFWEQLWDIWYWVTSAAPTYEAPPSATGHVPETGNSSVRDPALDAAGETARELSDGGVESATEWAMKRSRMGRNEIEDPQVSESVEKAVQGTGFLVVLDRILKGIFGSGQPVDDTDPGGEEEGLIYKRSDPRSDEEYVGQSKSPSRFDARQQEHNRGRGVQHEFEVLDRGTPGQDLDVREEDAIRRHGGLQKEGGRLASKRHQMSEKRYRDAGGKIDDPNR